MTRPGLQQITIDDFSPGIWDDWQASGGARSGAPVGAAQLTGTEGCIGTKGGGLMPGPKRVNRITQGLIDASGGSPGYPSAGVGSGAKMWVGAMRVMSPVWNRASFATLEVGRPNPFPDNLFFGFEWYLGASNTTMRHKQRVRLYKMSLETSGNASGVSPATYDIITQQTAASFGAPFSVGFSSIDLSRDLYTTPTTPGVAVAACHAVSNRGDAAAIGHVTYPDSNNNGADSTKSMSGLDGFGGYGGYAIFAHQDRINNLARTVNYGVGLNMEVPTDILIGTAVNDVTTLGYGPECFVAENPGLMGAWASINASEMFFVKQQFGGFVLRGDVSFPTVVRLPSLPATADAVNLATVAPNGMVVYGTKDGVYGWAGGDTATPLAPHLNGWFWKVTGAENFLHTKGSFRAHQNFVAAPNNFILDLDSGGWWRLPTTVPYAWYDTSAAGYLIASPIYVDATQTALADYYDFEQGQQSYTWKSQPLPVTRNRALDFRECDLVCSGVGTVTVTVTGLSGATSSASYTVNSTTPVAVVRNLGVHTHDAVVSISSDSGSSSVPAPRIYRLTLGYRDRATAAG